MSGIVGNNVGRGSGIIKAAVVGADAITGDEIADDAIDSEHYAAASIDNEHLADNAVDTDEIADNAVTLAKMAGGTDGQIITYDASGDPVAVGPGTDGQVLTSTGAGSPPAFEALPASGANTDLGNISATGENKVAQAWVAFNGSGTLAVLDSGGHTGVSSVTDNGTGDYSVTLASALGNANYAIAGSVTCTDGASGQRALEISSTNLPTTTVVRLSTSYVHATANRTKVDEVHISIIVFGD